MHTFVVGEYEQQFLYIRILSDIDENVSEKHVIDSRIRIRVPHDCTLDSSTQNVFWNVNECDLIFKSYYFWKMYFL